MSSANLGISESLRCMTSRSMVIDSIARWAICSIVPPGVSYTPRDLMPTYLFSVYSNRNTFFKADLDKYRLIRRRFRRYSEGKHVFRIRCPRVFKYPAFITDMKEIGITAIRFCLGYRHGNVMLPGILNQVCS